MRRGSRVQTYVPPLTSPPPVRSLPPLPPLSPPLRNPRRISSSTVVPPLRSPSAVAVQSILHPTPDSDDWKSALSDSDYERVYSLYEASYQIEVICWARLIARKRNGYSKTAFFDINEKLCAAKTLDAKQDAMVDLLFQIGDLADPHQRESADDVPLLRAFCHLLSDPRGRQYRHLWEAVIGMHTGKTVAQALQHFAVMETRKPRERRKCQTCPKERHSHPPLAKHVEKANYKGYTLAEIPCACVGRVPRTREREVVKAG